MNFKTYFFLSLFFLGTLLNSNAQSFNVSFLFNPGVTFGSEYTPYSSTGNNNEFRLIKHQAQFVLPLKTKLGIKGISLKELKLKSIDAKASQLFLTFNGSNTRPAFKENNTLKPIYGSTIGLTGITASIKKGIWIYAANLYFSENSNTLIDSPNPNFKGYITKVKIKNLGFSYFYGIALIIDQGRFIPSPIVGLRKKLSSKIKITLILPVQAQLNYKQNKKLNFDLIANFNSINAIYRRGSSIKGNNNTTNYRQLKTYLGINYKINRTFKLTTEIGYSSLQKLSTLSTDFSQTVNATSYISTSINYRFGKSVFNNFINKVQ